LLVLALFAGLLAPVPQPLGQLGYSFWIYYGVLTLYGLAASLRMSVKTVVSLLIASWLIRGQSDTLGAYSGLWLFENDRTTHRSFWSWLPGR